MATTKSYSDLQQSKKLAEFLPLESADMSWIDNGVCLPYVSTLPNNDAPDKLCGCWSLAALLNVIPISYKDEGQYCFALINTNSKADPFTWCSCYEDDHGTMMFECYAENPVDACVDMIIKLKKFNLL